MYSGLDGSPQEMRDDALIVRKRGRDDYHTVPKPVVEEDVQVAEGAIVPVGITTNRVDQFEGSDPASSSEIGTPEKNANRNKFKTDDVDGRLKLNNNGSVLNGSAGSGMVLRDHDGNFIFSACRFVYDCDDVLESEILAIEEGLGFALQWSSLPIDVESDCLEPVAMPKDAGRNLSRCAFMIVDIKQTLHICPILDALQNGMLLRHLLRLSDGRLRFGLLHVEAWSRRHLLLRILVRGSSSIEAGSCSSPSSSSACASSSDFCEYGGNPTTMQTSRFV
ncbi:hypothetical protein D1007_14212 [Hordeum vulgare]|nr:hypothetical protein D1007_14212 [Hordeum vulgare]